MGSTNAASPRSTFCQVIGTLTPLVLMPVSPSTSLLPPECALYPPILGLNNITRLRDRNDWSSQLSVRLRSTWLKDVERIGPYTTPTGIDPYPRPPCLVASLSSSRLVSFHIISTWFFSTIANIANRAIYEYPYILQVIGNHPTSTA
jgi:hypothetical protein